jgi:hypothetical protein
VPSPVKAVPENAPCCKILQSRRADLAARTWQYYEIRMQIASRRGHYLSQHTKTRVNREYYFEQASPMSVPPAGVDIST